MAKNTTFCPKYDYRSLRGKIKEIFGAEYKFAEALGRTQNYLTKVWNGISYFEQRDIDTASMLLGIPFTEIGKYFFYKKSSQNENTDNVEQAV